MWYYKIFKVITDLETYWCIKEYFPKISIKNKKYIQLWTKDAITPIGNSKKDLIEQLKMMLYDIKHHKVQVEDLRKKKK